MATSPKPAGVVTAEKQEKTLYQRLGGLAAMTLWPPFQMNFYFSSAKASCLAGLFFARE